MTAWTRLAAFDHKQVTSRLLLRSQLTPLKAVMIVTVRHDFDIIEKSDGDLAWGSE